VKTYIAIPALFVLCALGTSKLNSAPATTTSHPTAKECSDCGCSGPSKGGGCPDEKGKTCKCGKK
jgi:hypothetical protein